MNKQQFDTIPIIPLSVIEDAKKGNSEALGYVLAHFKNYIHTLATREFEDKQGNIIYVVDEDIVSRLEAKLVLSIVNDFVIPY